MGTRIPGQPSVYDNLQQGAAGAVATQNILEGFAPELDFSDPRGKEEFRTTTGKGNIKVDEKSKEKTTIAERYHKIAMSRAAQGTPAMRDQRKMKNAIAGKLKMLATDHDSIDFGTFAAPAAALLDVWGGRGSMSDVIKSGPPSKMALMQDLETRLGKLNNSIAGEELRLYKDQMQDQIIRGLTVGGSASRTSQSGTSSAAKAAIASGKVTQIDRQTNKDIKDYSKDLKQYRGMHDRMVQLAPIIKKYRDAKKEIPGIGYLDSIDNPTLRKGADFLRGRSDDEIKDANRIISLRQTILDYYNKEMTGAASTDPEYRRRVRALAAAIDEDTFLAAFEDLRRYNKSSLGDRLTGLTPAAQTEIGKREGLLQPKDFDKIKVPGQGQVGTKDGAIDITPLSREERRKDMQDRIKKLRKAK